MQSFILKVNSNSFELAVDPDTPLLYVLREQLGLKGPKYGCGLEQCNAIYDAAGVRLRELPFSG